MKYLFVLIFILTFILFENDMGYTNDSPIYTHLTYMFQHSGILHLTMNSIAFIGVFHTLQKFLSKWIILPMIILSGFLASFPSAYAIPTVGASTMIYTMIGAYISITLLSREIKITDTRKYLLFIFCVAISLLLSLLNQGSNFLAHFHSLIFGFSISIAYSLKNNRATCE